MTAEQDRLFNEAEAEAKPSLPEPTMEEITYKRRKTKGKREEQLKDLPVETIEYRLSPEEQVCSCGGPLHEMSTEVRQEIKVIPAQTIVVKHVRYTYACRRCEREEINTPVITAPMPNPVLPGSLASPSTVAHIMTQKYVESMPLYRQEQALARQGIELSRQTLANWMLQCSERWLLPLYERMHEHLLKKDVLHADETTLQVLREPDRPALKAICTSMDTAATTTCQILPWWAVGRMPGAALLMRLKRCRRKIVRQRWRLKKGWRFVTAFSAWSAQCNALPRKSVTKCGSPTVVRWLMSFTPG